MSFKREMDLEERLNDIASKAVREPSQEEFTNPFKSSVSKPNSTSKEQIDMDDIRELTIEAQLAKIATNAIVDRLGMRPTKIKSDVTKEMILDYQNDMLKPIEVGGVKYKYHPSSVDLDVIEYEPLHKILEPVEIKALEGRIESITKTNSQLEEAIVNLFENENQIKREYDTVIGQIASDTSTSLQFKAEESKKIRERNSIIKGQIEQRKQELLQEINANEMVIDRMKQIINENERKKSENKAEETRIKNINKARIKAYEEDLNLLNRGRMNVTRQPNETDDEYKIRLLETGAMTINEDDMLRSADLYNRDKLRERIMELVRDTGIISNAIKFLDIDQVFKINQNWSRIKRDFLKVYGFDNKTVKEVDLIDFFEQEVNPIIDDINKGKVVRPPPAEEPVISEATARALLTYDELNSMNMNELKAYYLTLKPAPSKWSKAKSELLKKLVEENLVSDKEPTGKSRGEPAPKSSIKDFFPLAKKVYSIDELRAIAQPVIDRLKQKYKKIETSSADMEAQSKASDIIFQLERAEAGLDQNNVDKFYDGLDAVERISANTIEVELPEIYPRAITGSGLQPIKHDIPNLIEFGKVKISPRKLYYNNTLVIKHKSGNSLAGLPNVQVSDKFVSIIMNLLKGKKPSLKDFTQLELSEKQVYDSLVYIAGLQKEVDNNFGETKQQLKNRLELVEGEIGAGNTNPKLKKELHSLLGKMAHTGMIGYGDAKRHFLNVTK